jgi:RNA polymerase sigma-70 factor (ECF subfamily)
VQEVPIDVLADRLGSTRNALYKTLHDARSRLRAALTDSGQLEHRTDRSTS